MRLLVILSMSLVLASSVLGQRREIPFAAPEDIRFGTARFELPDPGQHRVELDQGLVVFLADDEQTDTVRLTALIGASRLDDPSDKAGLAAAVAFAMRQGHGDELYRMSATLGTSVDAEHTRLSMSFLREDLDDALSIFVRALRAPSLDNETLERFRSSAARPPWNPDDPRARPEFEFSRLVYGDHPAARRATADSVARISVDDLRTFHARFYVPNNVVLAASGGFDRAALEGEMRQRLFTTAWPLQDVTHSEVPPIEEPDGRVIHAWDVDRLQGWAVIGHMGSTGRTADRAALEVANYVLGGGGAVWKRVAPDLPPSPAEGHFDARLFNESRAMRGLTNDTSSYVPAGFRVPAPIYAVTLGRPESMGFLFKIVVDQWERIRTELSEDDVAVAKGALTEGYFQMRYAGAHNTALSLAEELFFQGSHDWAQDYERAVLAVTKEQAVAAARKYYRPEALVAALVGPLDEMLSQEHPLYKAKLTDFGTIRRHDW